MDPRSTATKLALLQQQELGVSIYNSYRKAEQTTLEIRKALANGSPAEQDKTFRSQLQSILRGDPSSTEDAMGLTQIQASLIADLTAVRSGYDAPTAQAILFYKDLDISLQRRISEWQQLKKTHHIPVGTSEDAGD
jgi:hypothetical protein